MTDKIKFQNNKLYVPDQPVIPFIEGDGVGREIWQSARIVFDHTVKTIYQGKRKIFWKEVLAGEKAFKQTGNWLPEETLNAFKEYRVGIKGPLTTPVGEGIRSLNVTLRQQLDLFVCLRPIRWFKGVSSPVKRPDKVKMHIFRENTEDIYAGIEWMQGTPEVKKVLEFLQKEMGIAQIKFPSSSSLGLKPVSVEGSERLIRSAIEYALAFKLPSVTLVHKGNIMKFTEGGFKKWGYALAEREFTDKVFTQNQYDQIKNTKGKMAAEQALADAKRQNKVIINDVIADAFLQNTLLIPEKYSVIATLNLNGDYISDQLAAMVGGIGIAPGANINYANGYAIFEATHGTAPDLAGLNIANPSSLLLSGVMMFNYLGWEEVGKKIITAMETLFQSGQATIDLARFMPNGEELTTNEFTQALLHEIR